MSRQLLSGEVPLNLRFMLKHGKWSTSWGREKHNEPTCAVSVRIAASSDFVALGWAQAKSATAVKNPCRG